MMINYAFDDVISITSIAGFVNTIDNVRSSVCALDGKRAVIAIVSQPLFTKSDRENLMQSVGKSVAQEFDLEQVVVSMDSDIYYLTQCLKEGEDLTQLLNKALKRGGNYEYNSNNREEKR